MGIGAKVVGVVALPVSLAEAAHEVGERNNAERVTAGEISQAELRAALLGKEGSDPKIRDHIVAMLADQYNVPAGLDPASIALERTAFIQAGIHRILQNNGASNAPNDMHLTRNGDGTIAKSGLGSGTGEVLTKFAADITGYNLAVAGYEEATRLAKAVVGGKEFAVADAGKNGSLPGGQPSAAPNPPQSTVTR